MCQIIMVDTKQVELHQILDVTPVVVAVATSLWMLGRQDAVLLEEGSRTEKIVQCVKNVTVS